MNTAGSFYTLYFFYLKDATDLHKISVDICVFL